MNSLQLWTTLQVMQCTGLEGTYVFNPLTSPVISGGSVSLSKHKHQTPSISKEMVNPAKDSTPLDIALLPSSSSSSSVSCPSGPVSITFDVTAASDLLFSPLSPTPLSSILCSPPLPSLPLSSSHTLLSPSLLLLLSPLGLSIGL